VKLDIFNYRFLLIPVAVPAFYKGPLQWREVLIFGFRVAYWTIKPWNT